MIVLTIILALAGIFIHMVVMAYSVAWGLGIYNARKLRRETRDDTPPRATAKKPKGTTMSPAGMAARRERLVEEERERMKG